MTTQQIRSKLFLSVRIRVSQEPRNLSPIPIPIPIPIPRRYRGTAGMAGMHITKI